MGCTLIGHSAIKSLENARWRGPFLLRGTAGAAKSVHRRRGVYIGHSAESAQRALPPDLPIEFAKAGRERLRALLDARGHKVFEGGYNLLAVHKSDPVVQQLQLPDLPTQSAA